LEEHFYVAVMTFALRVFLVTLACFPFAPASFGQAELIEEVKRLAGEVADLRDANATQTRRITQMQKEIDSLREALRDSHERSMSKLGDYATREDLKKIVENIREVDQKRDSDRRLILEEFEKLGRTLSQPVERPNNRRNATSAREKESEKEAAPIEGTFLPYKVKDGQRLSDILKEYNTALKEQGIPPVTLEQVKRANPKLNVNRILVGQEILLPVPEKKK
jgi:TolA-binding protein